MRSERIAYIIKSSSDFEEVFKCILDIYEQYDIQDEMVNAIIILLQDKLSTLI